MMDLQVNTISKTFISLRGKTCALNNINLTIKEGEFFVLLGPSGCGKTTLLNIISGLEKPTEGEISFGNETVVSCKEKIFLSPKERNIAFVFQSYALYPHLDVFENIAFPLKAVRTHSDEIEKRVKEIASMLAISHLLKARPAELSGGQRQRVAIARALVRKPTLFLMDEPLSNLDAQLRGYMRAELKSLQKKLNITTIYVTHDQTEALSLGDRIALLKDGELIQCAPADELYEHPVNSFAGSFIGSPPMNLVQSKIEVKKGNVFLLLGGEILPVTNNSAKENLSRFSGKSFILGIRPEDISLSDTMTPDSIEAQIVLAEQLGRETTAYLSIGIQKLSAVSSRRDLRSGKRIFVLFNFDKIHIFEK